MPPPSTLRDGTSPRRAGRAGAGSEGSRPRSPTPAPPSPSGSVRARSRNSESSAVPTGRWHAAPGRCPRTAGPTPRRPSIATAGCCAMTGRGMRVRRPYPRRRRTSVLARAVDHTPTVVSRAGVAAGSKVTPLSAQGNQAETRATPSMIPRALSRAAHPATCATCTEHARRRQNRTEPPLFEQHAAHVLDAPRTLQRARRVQSARGVDSPPQRATPRSTPRTFSTRRAPCNVRDVYRARAASSSHRNERRRAESRPVETGIVRGRGPLIPPPPACAQRIAPVFRTRVSGGPR